MITYKTGDLFDNLDPSKNIIVPHICNNRGGWGAGFVLAINKFSQKPKESYLTNYKNGIATTDFILCEKNIVIANMIAQDGFKPKVEKPIRYVALVTCMVQVKKYCKQYNREIYAPKFGSGLAGGNWDFIEELINEIWGEIPVTIFTL